MIKSAGIEPELIDKLDTVKGSEHEHPKEFEQYKKFHALANTIERQFIENLGLNWEEHDRIINTAKVKIAVQEISDELHKENPSEDVIEKATEDVKDEVGERLE